jgi:hypothetical protein
LECRPSALNCVSCRDEHNDRTPAFVTPPFGTPSVWILAAAGWDASTAINSSPLLRGRWRLVRWRSAQALRSVRSSAGFSSHSARLSSETPRLPADVALVGQAQVGLVDQGGRLQGLAGRQVGHAGAGQLVQFLVHGRQQPLRRPGLAGLGGTQQFRDGLVQLSRHGSESAKKLAPLFPQLSAVKRTTARAIPTGHQPRIHS